MDHLDQQSIYQFQKFPRLHSLQYNFWLLSVLVELHTRYFHYKHHKGHILHWNMELHHILHSHYDLHKLHIHRIGFLSVELRHIQRRKFLYLHKFHIGLSLFQSREFHHIQHKKNHLHKLHKHHIALHVHHMKIQWFQWFL